MKKPARTGATSGRPKDRRKRAAILAAARRMFLNEGLAATSLEAVAAAAGVSKVTVYGHFGDKTGLFEAVVLAKTEELADALGELGAGAAPLGELLVPMGERLLAFLTQPELQAFDRLLSQAAAKHPALARRFFAAGPGRVRRLLAGLIAEAARRGEISPDDPERAAEDLLVLWRGMLDLEIRLGGATPPDARQRAERIRRATAVFMRAHGTSGPAGSRV
jgi:TetR/AcrR family transcriptional regulator, mexJK operon transcriptional repressor